MRGIKAMVTETSVLDPEEGIRYVRCSCVGVFIAFLMSAAQGADHLEPPLTPQLPQLHAQGAAAAAAQGRGWRGASPRGCLLAAADGRDPHQGSGENLAVDV